MSWLDDITGVKDLLFNGVALARRSKLQFLGSGVTVADDPVSGSTLVTVTGGGSGSGDANMIQGTPIDTSAASPSNLDALVFSSSLGGWTRRPLPLSDYAVFDPQDYAPTGVTLGTGANQPLSGKFATLTAAQAVYPFATSLSQQLDYCCIQAAINAACNTGGVFGDPAYRAGGKVRIRRPGTSTGNYRIDTTLVVTNCRGLQLEGEGLQAVQLAWYGAAGQPILQIDGEDVQITGIKFTRAVTSRPSHAIKIVAATAGEYTTARVQIIDCTLNSGGGTAAWDTALGVLAGTEHVMRRGDLDSSYYQCAYIDNGATISFDHAGLGGQFSLASNGGGYGVYCNNGAYSWYGNGGGRFQVAAHYIVAATAPITIWGYNDELSAAVLVAGASPSSAPMQVSLINCRHDGAATSARSVVLNAAGPFDISGNCFLSSYVHQRIYLGSTSANPVYHIEGNTFGVTSITFAYSGGEVDSGSSTYYRACLEYPQADSSKIRVYGDGNIYSDNNTGGTSHVFPLPQYFAVGGLGINGKAAHTFAGSASFVSGQQELTVNLNPAELDTNYFVGGLVVEKTSGTMPDGVTASANTKATNGFHIRLSTPATGFACKVSFYIWRAS